MAITSLLDWGCFSFYYRSGAWQIRNIKNAMLDLRPGLRAFRITEVISPLQLAAFKAWWQLLRSSLEQVAGREGIPLHGLTTTFDIIYQMTKSLLKISDGECCDILLQRMSELMQSSKCTAEILSVDETAQCLRDDGRQEVLHLQHKAMELEAQIADFQDCHREKRAAVRVAQSGQSSCSKGASKKDPWTGPR